MQGLYTMYSQLSELIADICDKEELQFSIAETNISNSMLFGLSGAFPLFAMIATQTAEDVFGEEDRLGITLTQDEDALLQATAEVDESKPISIQLLFMMDAILQYVKQRHDINPPIDGEEHVIALDPLIEAISMSGNANEPSAAVTN